MNREQFFHRIGGLDRPQLAKVLWTLYWRGSAAFRERIETELTAAESGTRPKHAAAPHPDPAQVRADVNDFVTLARAGSYMAGDRRVSPKERTRWRFTFRRLAADAQRALREPDPVDAIAAVEQLIELAIEMDGYDYFRSEDPVEAAGFVVSDTAALLWGTVREHHRFAEFAQRAAAQLIRWESRHGWTRIGEGRVAQKETSLSEVLVGMLRVPDAWVRFADAYLDALDDAAHPGRHGEEGPRRRTEALGEWNLRLLDQLLGTEAEDRLDRLVEHVALAGPEQQYRRASPTVVAISPQLSS